MNPSRRYPRVSPFSPFSSFFVGAEEGNPTFVPAQPGFPIGTVVQLNPPVQGATSAVIASPASYVNGIAQYLVRLPGSTNDFPITATVSASQIVSPALPAPSIVVPFHPASFPQAPVPGSAADIAARQKAVADAAAAAQAQAAASLVKLPEEGSTSWWWIAGGVAAAAVLGFGVLAYTSRSKD
jgi:hypothetical protein